MGEAKRRARETPSDDRIALQLEIFSPLGAMLDFSDNLHLKAVSEMHKRAHQWPTPICDACDYGSSRRSRRSSFPTPRPQSSSPPSPKGHMRVRARMIAAAIRAI
jgi:hypothetical protein